MTKWHDLSKYYMVKWQMTFRITFHFTSLVSSVSLIEHITCTRLLSVIPTDCSSNTGLKIVVEHVSLHTWDCATVVSSEFNSAPKPLVISTVGTSCRLQKLNYSEALGLNEVHCWIPASAVSAAVSLGYQGTSFYLMWTSWTKDEECCVNVYYFNLVQFK